MEQINKNNAINFLAIFSMAMAFTALFLVITFDLCCGFELPNNRFSAYFWLLAAIAFAQFRDKE